MRAGIEQKDRYIPQNYHEVNERRRWTDGRKMDIMKERIGYRKKMGVKEKRKTE